MDERVEDGKIDFWRSDLGFGKALDYNGQKVFVHRNQYKVRDGPRWRSADPPSEILCGTAIKFVAKDNSGQDRQAAKWTLVSE